MTRLHLAPQVPPPLRSLTACPTIGSHPEPEHEQVSYHVDVEATVEAKQLLRWMPTARRLHLVDVENLAGGRTAQVATAARAYDQWFVGAHDHVVVGSGPTWSVAVAIREVWPRKVHRVRAGMHGGELAILDQVDLRVIRRYDLVLVGSGDGMFTELADALRLLGVPCLVVASRASTSSSLRRAATACVHFQVQEREAPSVA
jgi:hypothetical protein